MCFIENAWLCKPNLIKTHNSYFIVPDEKLAIQVSYSIKEETTTIGRCHLRKAVPLL